jgi:hypothetical protein
VFGQLVAASQHLYRKLRDIADEVEQTGALPGKPKQRQLRARPGGLTPVTAGPNDSRVRRPSTSCCEIMPMQNNVETFGYRAATSRSARA